METQNQATGSYSLTSRDYFLVTFIGISFALFAIPILKNIQLPFIQLNLTFVAGLVVVVSLLANIALWIASLIAKKIPVVLQIAKFAAVGAFNTFLDWGVLNLLMAMFSIYAGIGYGIFKAISFLVANSGSYFWNKYWTFSSNGEEKATGNFIQFFAVTLVGLAVNVGVAMAITNFGPRPETITEAQWANVGVAAATFLSLVWNFLGYKFIVFKK